MRTFDRAENKVEAWPTVHDDKAVVICAGKIIGATRMTQEKLAAL